MFPHGYFLCSKIVDRASFFVCHHLQRSPTKHFMLHATYTGLSCTDVNKACKQEEIAFQQGSLAPLCTLEVDPSGFIVYTFQVQSCS